MFETVRDILVALCILVTSWNHPITVTAANPAAATLTIWYGTDDPTEAPLAQSLAARFESNHRGVNVRLSTFGLEDLNTKLQLAMSGAVPPDLIYTTPRGPGLPTFLRAGRLRDLTGSARLSGWAAALPGGMLSSYNDLLMPTGQADGKVFAVPMLIAAVGILYNKQVFNRLHLAVPHTIGEFEAVCAKVKAAGLVPISFGNADGWVGDDWYLTLVNAITGPRSLLSEQRLDSHFNFDRPDFRIPAAKLVRWVDLGYFTQQFGGLDAQDSTALFFDGHTAMQLISSTQNGQVTSLAQGTRIPVGVFAFPSLSRTRKPVMPQSGYAGWAVPRDGRQPALALEFINDTLSDQTAKLLRDHGLLPARVLSSAGASAVQGLVHEFMSAMQSSEPGVYLDGAPVPNLNATMEANIQLLLQHFETPSFLTRSLQLVYGSHGANASVGRSDGEF